MTYVALLRGINVGGNTLVSMRVLKDLFEQLGFGGVKTYGLVLLALLMAAVVRVPGRARA